MSASSGSFSQADQSDISTEAESQAVDPHRIGSVPEPRCAAALDHAYSSARETILALAEPNKGLRRLFPLAWLTSTSSRRHPWLSFGASLRRRPRNIDQMSYGRLVSATLQCCFQLGSLRAPVALAAIGKPSFDQT